MLDFDFHIDTPRLWLCYFDATLDTHCDFLVDVHNTPEIVRGNGGVAASIPDRETARKNIEGNNDRIETTGYGRYLVCLKTPALYPDDTGTNDHRSFCQHLETSTKVGIVSMKVRTGASAPTVPDIGFSFLPLFWGNGYATEAAAALINYFEGKRGQSEFVGYCNPDNESSKSVLRRLGFKTIGLRALKGIARDGRIVEPLVWSRGLGKSLEEYGL